MKKAIVAIAIMIGSVGKANAQHEHSMPAKDTAAPVQPMDSTGHHNHQMMMPQDHDKMQQGHNMDHGAHMLMSHAYSLHLPMNRNGSGTAWQPDATPMYGYMFHTPKWMYMVHGSVFLRYTKQDLLDKGSRGADKFDAPDWAMLMGQRRVGENGLFHFNAMVSLDPITESKGGYPLLFQTGESYKGQPLVDKQHPHDLFSELSVSYAQALSPKADVFAYIGYPGEPALGPAAFMHRPSALANPDAPLSHHWVDATHITFGVATVGVRYGDWKLEGSSFTGREPDEDRYNFDKPRFDSWSGRLSYNPTEKWAMQVSHGFIRQPENLHPNEDVNRTTASVQFSSRGYGNEFVNLTAIWGMNKTKNHNAEHAALLEGNYAVRKWKLYGRYEWVQKSREELNLSETTYGHDAVFPVHAVTAGLNYDLFHIGKTNVALGGQLTFYNPDERLSALYGQNPLAGEVFLRIYPGVMGRKAGSLFLPD